MADQDFDALYNVAESRHYYQFYKSTDDYLNVVIPYLRAGLEKGQACLWLVAKKTGIQHALSRSVIYIPGVETYFKRGQYEILPAEDWYLTNGHFDQEKASANALKHLEKIKKAGFRVLRGVGDAAAIPREDWQKVQVYEKAMAEWIRTNPVVALCAYPILECSLNETKSVLDCHDDVLVGHF